MKYLAVLGRQADISLAELNAVFGDSVRQISPFLAVFEADVTPDINRLGGTQKLARLLEQSPVDFLMGLPEGKITLGISDYSRRASVKSVRLEGMKLKKILKRHGRSVRILDNKEPVLSNAASHHNQLSEKTNHIELIIVGKEKYVLVGVQNITAYARRDQARPARDAKVGMLPPKLAQILINLCGVLPEGARLLDPFCGTGVVLQEAYLMGYKPYGTDLSERMVEYSRKNLKWLTNDMVGLSRGATSEDGRGDEVEIEAGDAMSYNWSQPINAVACETYLGPPMSNPPAEIRLKEVKQECREIILGFLKNLAPQIKSGTPVTIAIPSWLRQNGQYSGLNILDELDDMGYNVKKYSILGEKPLLYYREGQVVAREIIGLRKK